MRTLPRRSATAAPPLPPQVILRWALQRGVAVIPRSRDPAHVAENADLLSFGLSGPEEAQLDALEHLVASPGHSQPRRPHGDHFGVLNLGL